MRNEKLSNEAREMWKKKFSGSMLNAIESLVALAVAGDENAMWMHKELSEKFEFIWELLERSESTTRATTRSS